MKEETKDFQKEDAEVKKPVTLLERTLKYKGSVLEVYDDYVGVGGHKPPWDFFHHMGAAAVLPVLANGKILMVKQFRHALNRYTLEIPAGKRDSEDEDFLLCAKRELQEETGFSSANWEFLLFVNTTVAFLDEKIGIYVAKDLQKGEQHFDVDEEIFLEEWELSDLQELIFAGKLTDGKTVAAIQSYAVKLQKEKQ
jgi:MutT/NUDIX family protein